METLLPGVTSERVATGRLGMAVLSVTRRSGDPVLFVHGNVSSSLFWQPTMLAPPDAYRPLAVDLRGYGETDPEPVDAPTAAPRRSQAADRSFLRGVRRQPSQASGPRARPAAP